MCEPATIATLAITAGGMGYSMYEQREARKDMEDIEIPSNVGAPSPREKKKPMQFRDEDSRRQRGLGVRRLTIPMGQTEAGGKSGVNVPQ